MPLTQTELKAIEEAFGTSGVAGRTAPYGHTVQGALNVLTRAAEDMVGYGLEPADLPSEKKAQMREAIADLEHYRQKLATLFADDLKGELEAVELPDGTVVQLPEPASQ
jgi:hypothetical protein